jgi:uncharacterized protein
MKHDHHAKLPEWLSCRSEYIRLQLKIIPRSSHSALIGCEGGRLKVRLKAPPVEGRANKELIGLFAKLFKLPKCDISIETGEGSRFKSLGIHCTRPAEVVEKINQTLDNSL